MTNFEYYKEENLKMLTKDDRAAKVENKIVPCNEVRDCRHCDFCNEKGGMEAVMISIQPKWCELIANGRQTIIVKKTKPKLETPFKCYIYCTKGQHETLWRHSGGYYHDANGKVIGEFVCDAINAVACIDTPCMRYITVNGKRDMFVTDEMYLDVDELGAYLGFNKDGYGWHISDLVIYDKPKCLGDFNHCGVNYHFDPPVTKPPQSWCYVEEREVER